MARRVETYIVAEDGRDKGKHFVITEMSAVRAEKWATRVLLALMASNPEIPDDFASLGMAGLAQVGLRSLGGVSYETLEPLLDQMMECVQHQPDPLKAHVLRSVIEDDIEEVMTLLNIRKEVWNIHTGFLQAATESIAATQAAARVRKPVTRMSRS